MEEFVRDVFIRNSKLSYTKRIKIQNSLHSTLGQLPLLTCKYRVDEGGDLIYTVASEVNETLWSRILSSIRKENENDSLCFLEKIRIEFDQVNKHTKQTKNDFYIFPLEKEVSVVQEFQSSVLHFLQNCTFSSATSSAAVSEQCDKIRKITFDAKTELDFFLLKMNNQFNKYAEEKLAYHRVMAKLKNLKSNTTCTYLYIRDITPELFATENIDYASLLNKNTKSPQEWITSISEIYTNANLTSSIQNTLDLNKFYEFQKVQFPLFKALEQKEIVKRRNNKELEGYNKTTQVKLDAFLEEEKHKLEKMKQLERRVSLFFRQTIDSLYYHEGLQEEAQEWDSRLKILQHKIDIPTRTEIALRNRNKLNTCHNLVDEIRANLRRIDTFRRRSFVQEEAHELVLSSLVPFIYGSLAASHEIEIKKRNGWKKITSGVIMDAPRRAGKSNLAAMMFACLLTSLPNVEIVVISNSANAAGSEMGILGQTRYFFSNLNPHQNLKHDNNKHVTYVVNSNDIRKLHSFSADAGDR